MMRPSRRRRMKRGVPNLSVSASDAEWEGVRRDAERRGLSIARYLVELAERDGGEAEPSMALRAEEQRELLEAVREIRSLVLEGADAAPLVRDLQERVAVRFAAWSRAMVRSGRRDRLMEALAAVLGADRAREAAASLAVDEPPAAGEPRQDRLL